MRRREREVRTEGADDRAGRKLTIHKGDPRKQEGKRKEEEEAAIFLS